MRNFSSLIGEDPADNRAGLFTGSLWPSSGPALLIKLRSCEHCRALSGIEALKARLGGNLQCRFLGRGQWVVARKRVCLSADEIVVVRRRLGFFAVYGLVGF